MPPTAGYYIDFNTRAIKAHGTWDNKREMRGHATGTGGFNRSIWSSDWVRPMMKSLHYNKSQFVSRDYFYIRKLDAICKEEMKHWPHKLLWRATPADKNAQTVNAT